MTEFKAEVVFQASPKEVTDALTAIEEKIVKASGAAKDAQGNIKGIGKAGKEGADELLSHISRMALGFGTLAGAGEKAFELIIDGLKSIIEFIPDCIEKTNEL